MSASDGIQFAVSEVRRAVGPLADAPPFSRASGRAVRTCSSSWSSWLVAPIYELAFVNGVGRNVEESGFGLIGVEAFSAPHEDLKVKGR